MSTKTLNDKLISSASSSSNCHCTNGVVNSNNVVTRLCKVDDTLRATINWIEVNNKIKVIMTTPMGSLDCFKIDDESIPESELDAKFLELFKCQHTHWGEE